MKNLSMEEVSEVAGGLSLFGWGTIANMAYDIVAGFSEGVQAARARE